MENREIEEKLLLCARDLEAVSLLLKDGGRYEGTVGKDLFTGIWQITTSIVPRKPTPRRHPV
jgi:hypothetical protein